MKRRDFIRKASTAFAAPLILKSSISCSRSSSEEFSILIKGGQVYDGLGSEARILDLGIAGDQIIAIGTDLSASTATKVIDAQDLAVSPGFIDIHGHTDIRLLANPNAESKIRQGMTTEVVGQDGSSMGPWTEEHFEIKREEYKEQFDVDLESSDLKGFFEQVTTTGSSINLASMIGLGTVRGFAIGMADRPATEEEMVVMANSVKEALAAGACGISTGLEYTPGAFASEEEIANLCMELKGTGLSYSTHMRNEDDQVLEAIEEAIRIGKTAECPVQLAHLKAQGQRNWPKAAKAIELIENANESGMDVTFDRYPYVAYSTNLGTLFPLWSREGGMLMSRLKDAETKARIKDEVLNKIERLGSWDAVQITLVQNEDYKWTQGRRVIAKYVREMSVMSLDSAIQKMTSAPAMRIGAKDRGSLAIGKKADICLFDPKKVQDKATFDNPHQYPEGIPFVIVNGELVINEEEHTGAKPGQVVRPLS